MDIGILLLLALGLMMRTVDEDRQMEVIVEKVSTSTRGGNRVLAAVRLAIAVVGDMGQPSLLQAAAGGAR